MSALRAMMRLWNDDGLKPWRRLAEDMSEGMPIIERRESRRELRDVEVEQDSGFSGNFKQPDDSILRLIGLVYLVSIINGTPYSS